MAKFLNNFPKEKITTLAKTIVSAYRRGFERDGKDISKKSTVSLYYYIGMEQLYREVIKEFEKINLQVTVHSVRSTPINRQYNFDHHLDRT